MVMTASSDAPMGEGFEIDRAFDVIWSKSLDLQATRGLVSDIKEAENLAKEFEGTKTLVEQTDCGI